ncbi:FAD/NAD(P)-binding protein [Roseovarius confluentis]|uniref:FAD/NAD(P)-binding protein n=1 Tax=Roseovarius confluentis TaxID=1852027 RepID=UPI000CDD6F89|nr:FAD/NAD(P)-binding protein [Roseovarius confluentis]
MAGENTVKIAVVGFGPRGLGALEALAEQAGAAARALHVDLFEPSSTPGAGPNFDPGENPVCQLNTPMRDIDIRPPRGSRCGAFADWQDAGLAPDAFPRRRDLGRYLETRYAELRRHGGLSLRHDTAVIDGLEHGDGGWMLRAGPDIWHGPYAEVLLTLGQPEVSPDEQLDDWQTHAANTGAVLRQAYPAWKLQRDAARWTGQTVAIRGLALSAFDVIRVLTLGQGGRFENGRYVPSGTEPGLLVPFSLDGLPPFPKPETAALDARFDPTEAETQGFAAAISSAAEAPPDVARRLVSDALLAAVCRVLDQLDGASGDAANWLAREWQNPGSQESGPAISALQAGISMADGSLAPSTGFVFGQVWRKWQDTLRRGYNPATTPPETASLLVGFDEGLKRYSYGPPVSACREVAALVAAGLVTLDLTADPDITLTGAGWTLASEDHRAEATVMVDGVLPSPDLSKLRAPLVTALTRQGRLCAMAEGLAANVAADGQMLDRHGAIVPGLAFLGRLALGSVIAADSIHDCFGQASVRWARGVLARNTPRPK